MERLAESFLSQLPDAARSTLAGWSELEGFLQGLIDEACSRMPPLSVSNPEFLRYLAERIPPPYGAEALQRVRASDLYLACACAAGDTKALELFDDACLADVRRLWARITPSGVSEDDVKQMVREKLFVGDGARPPKIREYSGRGELRNWTRVVATRLLFDLAGVDEKAVTLDEEVLGDADPELEYLKKHYRAEFKAAFEEAAQRLSKRERNLLRHQVVFGLSAQQIAAIYHVHRATVTRWLDGARARLSRDTRELLVSRVQVGDGQLGSILRLIASQLDLSLKRILS